MRQLFAAAALAALCAMTASRALADPLRRVDVAGDTATACGTTTWVQVDTATEAITASVPDRTWFCGALPGVAIGRVTSIEPGKPSTASLVAREAGSFATIGDPVGPSTSFGFIASDGSSRVWWARNSASGNAVDAFTLQSGQLTPAESFAVPYSMTSLDAYPWGPVVLGNDRRVRSYDATGAQQWELGLGHSASRVFAEPGYVIALGSGSATIADAITGERRGVIASTAQAAAVRDRHLYLSRPLNPGGRIDEFDLSGAAPVFVQAFDTLAFANDIAFTEDGRIFASTDAGIMFVDVGVSEPTPIPTYTQAPSATPEPPSATPEPTPTAGACRWECADCTQLCD